MLVSLKYLPLYELQTLMTFYSKKHEAKGAKLLHSRARPLQARVPGGLLQPRWPELRTWQRRAAQEAQSLHLPLYSWVLP